MESKDIKPKTMAFEVTGRCRFECRHCRAQVRRGGLEELNTQQCKQILLAVADYTKCTLIFTGGEPLEREDMLDLIDYSRSMGLQPVLATCGYQIDDAMMARLQTAGIQALSLSLDGASRETHDVFRQASGGFDAVMRAAELARAHGIPFQINTTLSRINRDEVIAIANLAVELGAMCFNPFILVPTQAQQDLHDQLLDPVEYETLLNELLQIKMTVPVDMRVTCGPQFSRLIQDQTSAEKRVGVNNGCLGGHDFGFINRRGDVQTCGFLNLKAGNLLENNYDFAGIWKESRLLQQIRDRRHYSGRCASCSDLNICGGCRARAFAAEGDYLAADPLCDKNRETA